jgi:MFS family permease
VITAVSVFAIAQGLTYPLLSFILERQGHSAAAIGLSAAMTPIGFMFAAPLVPHVARILGAARTVMASALLAALLLFLIGWTRDLLLWFPLRFLLGAIVLPLYILSEVWLIALAPETRRGRVLGIYTSVESAGFAAGPFCLTLVGSEGWAPFFVGITAFLGCFFFMAIASPRLPEINRRDERASLWSFLPLAPALLLAVFVIAAMEQASLSLLPVYGLEHGIGETQMSALLTAFAAGCIVMQLPVGWAAERWTAPRTLTGCAVASLAGCVLLPVLIGTPLMWPLVFFWNALAFGLYTVALIELGARFSGAMMVAGNAAFALMWGVGGITGPATAGAMMDIVGVQGLPLTLGVLCLTLTLVTLRRT